jgi:hypothetical protein
LLKVVSRFLMLSSRSFFRSLFLRYRGHPPPRSSTLFLPSWRIRTFWIPCSALALVHLFPTMFPLRLATFAWWDVLILVGENSFRGPQISWVPILLTSFLFHHATFGRQDTFLQVAADFLLYPLFPPGPFLHFLAALSIQIPDSYATSSVL